MIIPPETTLTEWTSGWCACKQERAQSLWYRYTLEQRRSNERVKKLAEAERSRSLRVQRKLPNLKALSTKPTMLICSDGVTVALRLVQLEISFLKFCECTCTKIINLS